MKKYISKATKPLLFVTLICFAIFAIGIILVFMENPNIGLLIGLISMGGLLGALFLGCYCAEKSRLFIIDTDSIVLPRGAEINGKVSFQKTVIAVSDITSIEKSLLKGDGLIAKDTNFYTLRLVDGKRVTVTLYAHGKQAETEIVEAIKAMLV